MTGWTGSRNIFHKQAVILARLFDVYPRQGFLEYMATAGISENTAVAEQHK
ncbi:hypothetical protein Paes_0768 [Prosthecochloris aestuarii DSM 271]|uniref:Uncharacterized protein n=1 Tax=Prosthecochloris aestuarii (strain DSM 271 / SK 413) TaxID=290512 RepID=B4S6X8_PROA2|nr:hypothetical protein Paes_0768 [Prosthecochloris aestuarii DSM 271]